MYLCEVPVTADIFLKVVNELPGLDNLILLGRYCELKFHDVEIHGDLAVLFGELRQSINSKSARGRYWYGVSRREDRPGQMRMRRLSQTTDPLHQGIDRP